LNEIPAEKIIPIEITDEAFKLAETYIIEIRSPREILK